MHHFLSFPAFQPRVWRGAAIGQLVAQGLPVLVLPGGGVYGVCRPVVLGLPEVVYQQVAGDRRYPGIQRCLVGIEAIQGAVDLDENFLREVLGRIRRSRKPIANVVDTAVEALDDIFPGGGVARYTAAY